MMAQPVNIVLHIVFPWSKSLPFAVLISSLSKGSRNFSGLKANADIPFDVVPEIPSATLALRDILNTANNRKCCEIESADDETYDETRSDKYN
jgi:hypothetical protein